jgi:hypothetical protein
LILRYVIAPFVVLTLNAVLLALVFDFLCRHARVPVATSGGLRRQRVIRRPVSVHASLITGFCHDVALRSLLDVIRLAAVRACLEPDSESGCANEAYP